MDLNECSVGALMSNTQSSAPTINPHIFTLLKGKHPNPLSLSRTCTHAPQPRCTSFFSSDISRLCWEPEEELLHLECETMWQAGWLCATDISPRHNMAPSGISKNTQCPLPTGPCGGPQGQGQDGPVSRL